MNCMRICRVEAVRKVVVMSLQGSSVIIIGGSSGMGLATARLAMEEKANVIIASRSREKLQLAVKQLDNVRAIVADITSESDIQSLFQEIDQVNHVFITAGRPLWGGIVETKLEILRSDVEQRFWGPIHVIRYAIPKMIQGSITFLSGQYGSRPNAGMVVTGAMNGAIELLAKGLALELAPIRFNAIAPGLIDTPLLGGKREGAAKWAEQTLPLKRMGLAEEVAQTAVLLMTNGFITGEVIHIDGGGRYV